MKNFDSRVYSINDILEWHRGEQLVLSPRFQRRSVWSDNARSYLMDTIIRGKPITKIFMKQKLNTSTQKSVREVVDGQQRLRTIINYVDDGFPINPKHNAKFGGLYFSQLSSVDDDIQASILNYELAVDLLVNMPDSEILDVFGRLNAYAVVLNEQERINADHFSPFKMLADTLGHKYYEVWTSNHLLSELDVLRMGDANLAADILIMMIDGIKKKSQIKKYYDQYEKAFSHDLTKLTSEFDETLAVLLELMGGNLRTSVFHRISLFYCLFASVYHAKFGLINFESPRADLSPIRYARIKNSLNKVEELFEKDISLLTPAEMQFKEDSRRATTDVSSRERRARYITELMLL